MKFLLSVYEIHPTMAIIATFNVSSFNPGPFILMGIPGLEQFHMWVGIPFFIIYLAALTGNSVLLCLIFKNRSLHEPMFFFPSMLAATDLILSNTCVPKTCSIFWLGPQEITFPDVLLRCFFCTLALPWILLYCWPWHLIAMLLFAFP